jgi:hypothetical protein
MAAPFRVLRASVASRRSGQDAFEQPLPGDRLSFSEAAVGASIARPRGRQGDTARRFPRRPCSSACSPQGRGVCREEDRQ